MTKGGGGEEILDSSGRVPDACEVRERKRADGRVCSGKGQRQRRQRAKGKKKSEREEYGWI